MAINWLDLPDDLLTMITNKLILVDDYVRFGATCVKWHSVFIENRHSLLRLPLQLPVLMLADPNSKHESQTRSFYSLTEKRVYDFKLPVPHNLMCRGSCFGWLFIVEDESLPVRLLNPFKSINNEILLPSLNSLELLYDDDGHISPIGVQKVVLSANPSLTSDYIVMIIYGAFSRLGFLKPGDKTWTSIELIWNEFRDVIYHNGQFYAVQEEGHVVTCDLSSPQPILIQIAPSLINYCKKKTYLVESLGELFLVRRELYFADDGTSDGEWDSEDDVTSGEYLWFYKTIGFQVFKFDPIGLNWVEVKSLLGRMFFLGDNSSMSLLASDFHGCKPNSIYFTDDEISLYSDHRPSGSSDIGVYNLEDGRFKSNYPIESRIIIPQPIWIQPTLQGCHK